MFASSCSSRRRGVVFASLIPCLWGKLQKPRLFEGCQAGSHVVLRGRRGTLSPSSLFDNVSKMPKLEEVSHETLVFYGGSCEASIVLLRSRRRVYGESCKTSFVLLRSRRRVYGGSCKASLVLLCTRRRVYGEAAKPLSFCMFCCVHVAGSMGKAPKHRVCASFAGYGSVVLERVCAKL